MTTLINLTPHALHIHLTDGSIYTLPASGAVARCQETTEHVGTLPVGTLPVGAVEAALTRTVLGAVTDLPEPAPDTMYIVSALVRLAVPHRRDVVSPGALVRDESGRPVGCQGLSVN